MSKCFIILHGKINTSSMLFWGKSRVDSFLCSASS
uniref:Uncharacterized protein n=1 Tax=Arundo donax TaxID=35708 RepID=A0A0A8ZZG4_ARUDO